MPAFEDFESFVVVADDPTERVAVDSTLSAASVLEDFSE